MIRIMLCKLTSDFYRIIGQKYWSFRIWQSWNVYMVWYPLPRIIFKKSGFGIKSVNHSYLFVKWYSDSKYDVRYSFPMDSWETYVMYQIHMLSWWLYYISKIICTRYLVPQKTSENMKITSKVIIICWYTDQKLLWEFIQKKMCGKTNCEVLLIVSTFWATGVAPLVELHQMYTFSIRLRSAGPALW